MTRGQRAAHRVIWLIIAPLGAILIIGAIAMRPAQVTPTEIPGATP